MSDYQKSNHTKWEHKYHTVWIPKFRKKVLYDQIKRELPEILRRLAQQKESKVEEGHICSDHVHILLSVPPKYSVAQVVGYLKGKSAIEIARRFCGKRRNFVGQNFWARGYCSSTVGRDEVVIRNYIKNQEVEDKRTHQLSLF